MVGVDGEDGGKKDVGKLERGKMRIYERKRYSGKVYFTLFPR